MKEQLPAFVLADLFTNSLVFAGDIIAPEPVKTEVPKPEKWYLGNYEKQFVVLVNEPGAVYLADEDLDFLAGILSACKLNLAQIALINFYRNEVSFQHLKAELNPAYVVSFGVNALQIQLPFSMPDYQVQQYSNCTILTAPSLKQLNQPTAEAKAEKTRLWKCLKKMLDL